MIAEFSFLAMATQRGLEGAVFFKDYSCLVTIKTDDQLDEALQISRQSTEEICILDVQLDPDDKSQTLERMAKAFTRRI